MHEEPQKSKSRGTLLAAMTLLATQDFIGSGPSPKRQPPERPCLNCGKPKQHNNSFCSPECCKAWRKS